MKGSVREARILIIGHSCLDSIAVSPVAVPGDGKGEATRIWTGSGGPAANAAIALSRLGHEVRLATSIGPDAAGQLIAAQLRSAGVNLLVPARNGGSSSLAQIRAVRGSRSVLWRRGALPDLDPDPGQLAGWVGSSDLLYLDGHEVAAASRALALAHEAGIPCVADLGSLRPGSEAWIESLSSAVATPRWLARKCVGQESVASALDALAADALPASLIGVSLGAQGGFARVDGRRLAWRARKTGVVDTTGAGDAFHAGLADGLLQGMAPQETLDWAATLAAAVCRAPGHSALPADRDELALWHGRWGYRVPPAEDLWGASPDDL